MFSKKSLLRHYDATMLQVTRDINGECAREEIIYSDTPASKKYILRLLLSTVN